MSVLDEVNRRLALVVQLDTNALERLVSADGTQIVPEMVELLNENARLAQLVQQMEKKAEQARSGSDVVKKITAIEITRRTGGRVYASITVVGFHHWAAPTPHRAYLGNAHRHLFKLTAYCTLGAVSNNRDIEFHDIQGAMRMALEAGKWPKDVEGAYLFGDSSCEMIASSVAHLMAAKYGEVAVSVEEDGECGAWVQASRAEVE